MTASETATGQGATHTYSFPPYSAYANYGQQLLGLGHLRAAKDHGAHRVKRLVNLEQRITPEYLAQSVATTTNLMLHEG